MADENPRIKDLREFCERHGWGLSIWTATQREPMNGFAIKIPEERPNVVLKTESSDSLDVALARLELALRDLGQARGDAYLHEPPHGFGGLRG